MIGSLIRVARASATNHHDGSLARHVAGDKLFIHSCFSVGMGRGATAKAFRHSHFTIAA
jgi:hypothetical protein